MSFSDEQLLVWSVPPSSTKPQETYKQVTAALENNAGLKGKIDIFLQGSYANSTNIKSESDVDIVAKYKNVWGRDLGSLSQSQKDLYLSTYPKATYTYQQYRNDVIQALKNYFGDANVVPNNKSIKIKGNGVRLNADVLPSFQYRKYNYFLGPEKQDFIEGVQFLTAEEGKQIINFPKEHIKHGEDKNHTSRTKEQYKNMVRIIKNIRSHLVDEEILVPDIAPSYFIECSVYNAPDAVFHGTYSENLIAIVNHLNYHISTLPSGLRAVNHQHSLLGQKEWEWNPLHAAMFYQLVKSRL